MQFHKLNFHFKAKQDSSIKYIAGILSITLYFSQYQLSPTKKRLNKSVMYLDVETNEFQVDFLNNINENLPAVSFEKINDFKDYATKKEAFRILKDCYFCNKYSYMNFMVVDFKNRKIKDIKVDSELLYLDNENLQYIIYNNFKENAGQIILNRNGKKESIDLPIIEITNKNELLEKLKLYSTFS